MEREGKKRRKGKGKKRKEGKGKGNKRKKLNDYSPSNNIH